MCTVVVLHRPGNAWPLVLAANRDEMADRPWKPPAHHWPDRPHVTGGLDRLAGGTWMALNDDGVVAAVLNRYGSLGPQPGKRSRGELPLEALDHATAADAAEALADLDPAAYRPFNMVVADAADVFWLKNDGESARVAVRPVPPGVSMVTAHDLNDTAGSPRIRRHLPRFRAAPAPRPGDDDWFAWTALLADRGPGKDGSAEDAMAIGGDGDESGFATVSASLLALPDPTRDEDARPVWLFAPGRPGVAPFRPVMLR